MKATITKELALHTAWMEAKGNGETWTLTQTIPDGGLRAEFNGTWFTVTGADLANEFIAACKVALAEAGK